MDIPALKTDWEAWWREGDTDEEIAELERLLGGTAPDWVKHRKDMILPVVTTLGHAVLLHQRKG